MSGKPSYASREANARDPRSRNRWSMVFFSRPFADSISPFSCALPGKLRDARNLVRVRQHKVIQQVRERLAGDDHFELAHARSGRDFTRHTKNRRCKAGSGPALNRPACRRFSS